MNPWGLTDNQARTMDVLLEHLGHKRAARILDVHPNTLGRTVCNIRKLMRCMPGCRFDHILIWDRYRREVKQPAMTGEPQ